MGFMADPSLIQNSAVDDVQCNQKDDNNIFIELN